MQPKKTPQEAYEEALQGINVKENEAIILASNNAQYFYSFARYVKESNIKALQEAAIKSNNAYCCYNFAKDIQGANIEALQEAVIKSNDAHYCYCFAKNIEGANIQALLEAVKLDTNYQEEVKELSALLKSRQIPDKTSKQKNSDSSTTFVSEKKEKSMTNSNNAMDFFKSNLIKGAYAGAAASAVDNLAKGFIASLKSAGVDEVSILLAEQAMQHPIGKAFLSFLLGSGIHFIPVDMVKNNAHLQEVANMCIQNAGAAGTTVAIEGVMNFILPALLGAINNNPQLNLLQQMEASTKMRVEAPVVPEEKTSSLSDQIPNLIQFKQSVK